MARWATVAEFPDYEVSDDGRVRRVRPDAFGRWTWVGHELRPFVMETGHRQVFLNGERRLLHRLVADAFIPNPHGHAQVNHKEGDPSRNGVDDLYWGTQAQNMEDRAKHGRQPRAANGWSRTIGIDAARAMRAAYTGSRGEISRLAEKFGVSPHVAGHIVRGKTYREDGGTTIRQGRTFGLNDFQRRVVVRLKGRMSSNECAAFFGVTGSRVRQVWRAA